MNTLGGGYIFVQKPTIKKSNVSKEFWKLILTILVQELPSHDYLIFNLNNKENFNIKLANLQKEKKKLKIAKKKQTIKNAHLQLKRNPNQTNIMF